MRSPLLLRKRMGVNKPLQSIAQHESDGKEVSHEVKGVSHKVKIDVLVSR